MVPLDRLERRVTREPLRFGRKRHQERVRLNRVVPREDLEGVSDSHRRRRPGHFARLGVVNGGPAGADRCNHRVRELEAPREAIAHQVSARAGRGMQLLRCKEQAPARDRTALAPHVAMVVDQGNEARIAGQLQDACNHAGRERNGNARFEYLGFPGEYSRN